MFTCMRVLLQKIGIRDQSSMSLRSTPESVERFVGRVSSLAVGVRTGETPVPPGEIFGTVAYEQLAHPKLSKSSR